MIDFDHRDTGTTESEWLTSALQRTCELQAPAASARLLVLAAHPDDETLGAGGLIATAHQRGAAVTVVVASDGEASHPGSHTFTAAQLSARRREEVLAAVSALAPGSAVHFLGLPDGRLADYRDALAAQVEYLARGATHIVCPWEGDEHPDHAACAHVGLANAQQQQAICWQYPIWAWHWDDPRKSALPWDRVRRLVLPEAVRTSKQQAVQCHRTQHSPLSAAPGDEAILSESMLAHFARPYEAFVVDGVGDASSPRFFEALYAQADDPWDLETRFYERRKRALLLGALPRERFRRAFEPGCATGLLTAELAGRCDEVVAWDVADRALTQTADRVAAYGDRVTVGPGAIPDDWPGGSFDLVVLSEVAYYCADLDRLVGRLEESLSADGTVAACHWRHEAPAHPWHAEQVHEALSAVAHRVVHHVEDDFLLDVWTRDGRSVARTTGVLG